MLNYLKKLTSRKFLLTVVAGVVVYLNPGMDAHALASILGLTGIFNVMEGIKDIKTAKK